MCISTSAIGQEEKTEAENTQEIDDLIEGHINALGGEMSLQVDSMNAKGQLLYQTGSARQPPKDFQVSYKNGVVAIQMNKGDDDKFKNVYGYYKEKQWTSNSGKRRYVDANSFGWMKIMPFLSQQVFHWRDWDAELRILEDATFDEQDVSQLEISVSDNHSIIHRFSKKSGLMIGSLIEMNNSKYIIRYKYKEIEGCKCVESIDVNNSKSTAEFSYRYEFTDFDFESVIPDELFKKPDDDEDSEDDESLEEDDDRP